MCGSNKDYPNLFRVAQTLSRCKHPDKVLGALHHLLESSVKDPANSGEDFGLTIGDVLSLSNSAR